MDQNSKSLFVVVMFFFMTLPWQAWGEEVVGRVPELEMYPCSDCHETAADYNTTQRTLVEEHDTLKTHYALHEEDGWCLRCHKENNYNKLRLQSGREISFNEAYQLCRECHSVVFKDWKINAHGKKTGGWNGQNKFFSCTKCHEAHDPEFKKMEAKPAPIKPVNTFWGF